MNGAPVGAFPLTRTSRCAAAARRSQTVRAETLVVCPCARTPLYRTRPLDERTRASSQESPRVAAIVTCAIRGAAVFLALVGVAAIPPCSSALALPSAAGGG